VALYRSDIEGIGFKLNDIFWQEMVPVRIDSGSSVIRSESSGRLHRPMARGPKTIAGAARAKIGAFRRKCCCTKSSSWTAGRGLSISISMECSAIFLYPAITGCPRAQQSEKVVPPDGNIQFKSLPREKELHT